MSHTSYGENDPPTAAGSATRGEEEVVGEARWPMAGAVLAAMVLTILLPDACCEQGRSGCFRSLKGCCSWL